MSESTASGSLPLSLCQVLEEELRELHRVPPPEKPGESAGGNGCLGALFETIHRGPRRAALCLSGGGIRSATFSLGVLQGLAQRGLLGKFDYLSTVSGGGYIGSWWTAWIHNRKRTLEARASGAAGAPYATPPALKLPPASDIAKAQQALAELAQAVVAPGRELEKIEETAKPDRALEALEEFHRQCTAVADRALEALRALDGKEAGKNSDNIILLAALSAQTVLAALASRGAGIASRARLASTQARPAQDKPAQQSAEVPKNVAEALAELSRELLRAEQAVVHARAALQTLAFRNGLRALSELAWRARRVTSLSARTLHEAQEALTRLAGLAKQIAEASNSRVEEKPEGAQDDDLAREAWDALADLARETVGKARPHGASATSAAALDELQTLAKKAEGPSPVLSRLAGMASSVVENAEKAKSRLLPPPEQKAPSRWVGWEALAGAQEALLGFGIRFVDRGRNLAAATLERADEWRAGIPAGAAEIPQSVEELACLAAQSAVTRDLADAPANVKLDPEAEPIRHLRAYSNYLNPRVGLLSADTWTLVATIARNLFLNWLVLIPLLAAVLLAPRIQVAFVAWEPSDGALDGVLNALISLGGGLGAWAIYRARVALPSVGIRPLNQTSFFHEIVVPLFFGAWFLTLYLPWHDFASGPNWAVTLLGAIGAVFLGWFSWAGKMNQDYPGLMPLVFFGVGIHLAGWLIGVLGMLGRWLKAGLPWKRAIRPVLLNLWDLVLVVASGAVGGGLLWVWSKVLPLERGEDFNFPTRDALRFACFATPAVLVSLLVGAALYIGLASLHTTDEDREWWARAGGWLLIGMFLWVVTNVLVIYGVDRLIRADLWIQASVASAGSLSGVITIFLGKSSGSAARGNRGSSAGWTKMLYEWAPKLAAPVFALLILLLIALGTTWLLTYLYPQYSVEEHLALLTHTRLDQLVVLLFSLVLFGLIMGLFVNVNKFSLHDMYRNRLIRAYLGASREAQERHPNPFTGFDPEDNIRMHRISPRQEPFHVLNITLNLTRDPGLSWQQRKAEPFTVTSLHSGSSRMQQTRSSGDTVKVAGAYRRSAEYASYPPALNGECGISLGTAVTISGAAANPNMGYHSSPLVSFLMTFFNARLGCWLGNPLDLPRWLRPAWRRNGPRISVFSLLAEALAQTDDKHPYVNLSDGAHFENLGLYEMVLRRCQFIMVLDNGADGKYAFDDLANALRKIRVDLGVPIEELEFREIGEKQTTHYVRGQIRYSAVDGSEAKDGLLVYVKPVLTKDEPADIFNYAKSHKDFPHQTTADQWFDESQFESYRMLGLHSVEKMPTGEWIRLLEPGAPRPREAAAGA